MNDVNYLYVKTITGKTITIPYQRDDTILQLKERIQDKEGYFVSQQRLILAGKALEDERTCSDYNQIGRSTVHLVVFFTGQLNPCGMSLKAKADLLSKSDFEYSNTDELLIIKGSMKVKELYWKIVHQASIEKFGDNSCKFSGEQLGFRLYEESPIILDLIKLHFIPDILKKFKNENLNGKCNATEIIFYNPSNKDGKQYMEKHPSKVTVKICLDEEGEGFVDGSDEYNQPGTAIAYKSNSAFNITFADNKYYMLVFLSK
jgi:ubiquitin